MFTKHSTISRWFAERTPPKEEIDSARPLGFVTRLGDVKVETKFHGGTINVDQSTPLDFWPD
jgi:hypothetical protein